MLTFASSQSLSGLHLRSVSESGQKEVMEIGKKEAMVADTADTVRYSESLQPIGPKEIDISAVRQRPLELQRAADRFEEQAGDDYPAHWEECVVLPEDGRMAGETMPFQLAADNQVSVFLLACLALSAFFIARSHHYLWVKAKEFLRTRSRENMFNDSSDERMTGKYFFSFILCVALSVLLFDYQQTYYPDYLWSVSPHWLLGMNVALLGGAYVLRTALYSFVNTVFFSKDKNEQWMESYHLLTVAANFLFFPLALLVAFYELDISVWAILFSLSMVFVEIFLIFKTYRIFFEGFGGILHLILYLCTLEILPLLTLWKGTVWVTQELTKLV